MDEFGVLTERFGLKPQGKAAPMASLKRPNSSNNNNNSKPSPFGGGGDRTKPYTNGGIPDDYDFLGGVSNSSSGRQSGGIGGASFDYDSFFSGSSSAKFNAYDNGDIFGGMPGLNTSSSLNYGSESKAANAYGDDDIFGAMPSLNSSRSDDILGAFDSAPKQGGPVGGLFDDFVSASSGAKNSSNGSSFFSGEDDLIPGFSSSTDQNSRKFADKDPWQSATTQSSKASFTSPEDPFVVLESTSTSTSKVPYASSDLFSDPLETISKANNSKGTKPPRLKSPPKSAQVSKGGTGSSFGAAKSSDVSSFDEFENFVMGGKAQNAQNSVNGRTINRASSRSEDDLESFFGVGPRSSSAPRARTTTPSDPIFDVLNNNNNKGSKGAQPRVPPNPSSGTSSTMKKSSSAGGFFGDLSSMFDGVQVSGEFEEVEGESEERRRARLGRYQRTNERVLKAMDDMNQRDFQSQQEQEERRRIAEAMDADIKRWAAGKEGNMRALLSSLQHILWPQCGWEPVSLTDIITSTSVKKVYRKATLCVHPDKVQQRGATLQQKYTAEKVFDILKEAWNKFNKEELRSLH